MLTLLNFFGEKFRGGFITIIGAITGQVSENVDRAFQHSVWALTSLVAILTIVSWVQKQKDRRKQVKKAKTASQSQ